MQSKIANSKLKLSKKPFLWRPSCLNFNLLCFIRWSCISLAIFKVFIKSLIFSWLLKYVYFYLSRNRKWSFNFIGRYQLLLIFKILKIECFLRHFVHYTVEISYDKFNSSWTLCSVILFNSSLFKRSFNRICKWSKNFPFSNSSLVGGLLLQ